MERNEGKGPSKGLLKLLAGPLVHPFRSFFLQRATQGQMLGQIYLYLEFLCAMDIREILQGVTGEGIFTLFLYESSASSSGTSIARLMDECEVNLRCPPMHRQ